MMRKACMGILVLVSASVAVPLGAQAKPMMMREIPLRKVADYWKTRGPQEKLSTEEARTALLARVAEETGAAETALVPYSDNESAAITHVNSGQILTAMLVHLSKSDWEPLSPPRKKPLKKNKAALKGELGENSFLWAWCLYQLGDRAGAKRILSALYTAESDRVMNLKTAVYGLDGGPLETAEYELRALLPFGAAEEVKTWNEQMQKMKIHVSNLPQSHILT